LFLRFSFLSSSAEALAFGHKLHISNFVPLSYIKCMFKLFPARITRIGFRMEFLGKKKDCFRRVSTILLRPSPCLPYPLLRLPPLLPPSFSPHHGIKHLTTRMLGFLRISIRQNARPSSHQEINHTVFVCPCLLLYVFSQARVRTRVEDEVSIQLTLQRSCDGATEPPEQCAKDGTEKS
jgi:hypothetical protein